MNMPSGPDGSMGDLGGGSTDGSGGDLQSAIQQLQQTAQTFSTQVDAVAQAAGMPPSGQETPQEDASETPGQETGEGASPDDGSSPSPDASGAPGMPYKKKPAGNVMSFINGKK